MHSLTPRLSSLLAVVALTTPAFAQTLDFSRLVVIGDSLAAGFQNGSLHADQQVHGFAKLVAQQAGVGIRQPLITHPGIPNVLGLTDIGPPLAIDPLPGTSSGRMFPSIQSSNLAVPGHTTQEALTARPDLAFDDLTDFVLGLPGLLNGVSLSQVEWAETLQPTVVVVWLGSNDVLSAALQADPSLITPQAQFEAAFGEVMERMEATGAALVVANVPNVSVIPYLTSLADLEAMLGVPQSVLGGALGIGANDAVIPAALPTIQDILTGAAAGPLPAAVVLDAGELDVIHNATQAFNAFIAAEALAKNAALVDVNTLLDRIDSSGLDRGGYTLTTDFLGGIFSLDGVHPTNSGHAILANHFIRAINSHHASALQLVPLVPVIANDPLVF